MIHDLVKGSLCNLFNVLHVPLPTYESSSRAGLYTQPQELEVTSLYTHLMSLSTNDGHEEIL